MTEIGRKVEHVKNERRLHRNEHHRCHWPGCDRSVPPAMWGCREHWYKLPKRFRDEIWRTYRVGQEVDKRPSEAYLAIAREIQNWISNAGELPPPTLL